MSGDYASACREQAHRPFWRVLQRKGNRSAFNGYHWTPSDYSAVSCVRELGGCGQVWRTKGAFVNELPDYDETERPGTTCPETLDPQIPDRRR